MWVWMCAYKRLVPEFNLTGKLSILFSPKSSSNPVHKYKKKDSSEVFSRFYHDAPQKQLC